MDPLEHVIYKIRNATVLNYPYPHFYIGNVFPEDFYYRMLTKLPTDETYKAENYANRRFASPEDEEFAPFHQKMFTQNVVYTFRDAFMQRFPDGQANLSSEWRLVRDQQGYKIGPHTDAPWKVISLLFYLPLDHSDMEAGTSIFVPEDHVQSCPGGPHYAFEGFKKVWTAPFLPNSCLGFWKNDISWHGVEPISRKIRRDVLLFNVYDAKMRPGITK